MEAVVGRDHDHEDLNDWLPITASRNANWRYSAFHNVTATVGAGVLSFPLAMYYLDWGGGTTVIVMSWVITLFTMWQLVEMHELTEEVSDGRGGVTVRRRRFDRYHELAQHAFGQRLGLWIVIPQQLIIEVGVDIVYMVTGGQSLRWFVCLARGPLCQNSDKDGSLTINCNVNEICPLNETTWIIIFALVHVFLAQLPSFNSLALVSSVAAAMSLSYSTIAWISLLIIHYNRGYDHAIVTSDSQTSKYQQDAVGVLAALGQIAFAYASHNVALEIQATMPSTPDRPSKKPMMQGALIAYLIIAICYFPVAFVGRAILGNLNDPVTANILLALVKPRALIAIGNLMVVIHMIGSYQLYAIPVFDIVEAFLVTRLHFQPSFRLRLIFRTIYVVFTCFVAVCIPFFGGLLAFFGGFAFTPLTYFMPCIIWLIIRRPRLFSLSWIINWVCIIIGVTLMIASTIGGYLTIKNNIDKCRPFNAEECKL